MKDTIARHRLAKRPYILSQSGAVISHTGTTNETEIKRFTVPGGVMGANGILDLDLVISATANANSKMLRVYLVAVAAAPTFGSTAELIGILTPGADATAKGQLLIANANSLTAQKAMVNAAALTSGNDMFTRNLNTANPFDVVISADLDVGTDTLRLEILSATVRPGA